MEQVEKKKEKWEDVTFTEEMIEDSKKEIKKVKRATIFTGLAMFFIAIFSIFKSFFDQERRK